MSWKTSEATMDRPCSPAAGKLRAWLRRVFESRQVLVRTDAGVRCVSLSTRSQLIAVGLIAALLAWPLASSLAVRAWSGMTEASDPALAGVVRERDAHRAAQRELERELGRLRAALAAEQARHRASEEQLQAERDSLSRAVATTEELEGYRAVLAERVAAQDQEILAVRQSRLTLADQLSEARLQATALSQRVSGLELELTTARRSYQTLVREMSQQMRENIESVRGIVDAVGLEPDALLAEARHEDGQGGPLLPAEVPLEELHDEAIREQAAPLYEEIGTWLRLIRSTARLPLTPPLEDFWVSSRFGTRSDPFTGRRARHLGLDLAAPAGTRARTPSAGTVSFAGWRAGYGRLVEIAHGNGVVTRYGHLKKILVEGGQSVEQEDVIGLIGSSGRSTGPHLHYEVHLNGRAVDPAAFFEAGEALAALTDTPLQLADAVAE